MDKKIAGLLNNQIQKEFESAYIYLGIASFFDESGLNGFGTWFKKQSQEEENHAMKIYGFMHDRNETVLFLPIETPKDKIIDAQYALELSLDHEKYITSLIWNIYREAQEAGDYSTKNFLEWFLNEQNEEEANARSMLDLYNLFGNCPEGLYALNKEFGERR